MDRRTFVGSAVAAVVACLVKAKEPVSVPSGWDGLEGDKDSVAERVKSISPSRTVICTGGALTVTGLDCACEALEKAGIKPTVFLVNKNMLEGDFGFFGVYIREGADDVTTRALLRSQCAMEFREQKVMGQRYNDDKKQFEDEEFTTTARSVHIMRLDSVPDRVVVVAPSASRCKTNDFDWKSTAKVVVIKEGEKYDPFNPAF